MWVEHVLKTKWPSGLTVFCGNLYTRHLIRMCKAYEVTKCMLMLYHTPSQHCQSVSLQSELYCCICHSFILL